MDILIDEIQSALLAVITIVYFRSILDYRLKKSSAIWLIGLGFFLLTSIMSLCRIPLIWHTLVTFAMIAAMCACFRGWTQILPAASFFIVALFLAEPATYFTIELVSRIDMSPTARQLLVKGGAIFARLISAIILYFCAQIFRLLFQSGGLPFRYLIRCAMIPLLSVGLIYVSFHTAFHGSSPILALVATFLIFLVDAVGFSLLIRMTRYYNEQMTMQKQLEQLDAFNQQQVPEISFITSLREIHHNMMNTMLSIRSALQDGKTESASEKIDQMLSEITPSHISSTGNFTVDSVINFKANVAEPDGIAISVYDDIQVRLDLNWVDVGVILSTALDNAIEACRSNPPDQRRIKVSIVTHNQILLIRVENPYSCELLRTGADAFETTKQNKEEHGFGVKTIKRLVEQHQGGCEFECENDLFAVTLILPEI